MSRQVFTLRWLTIDYSPHPAERPFLERAQSRREREVETTVAVPSDRESEWVFGVRLARHGLQAVWLEVVNGGEEPLWLDRVQLGPNYYTPLGKLCTGGCAERLAESGHGNRVQRMEVE